MQEIRLSFANKVKGIRRIKMSLFLISIFILVQSIKGLENHHQNGILKKSLHYRNYSKSKDMIKYELKLFYSRIGWFSFKSGSKFVQIHR